MGKRHVAAVQWVRSFALVGAVVVLAGSGGCWRSTPKQPQQQQGFMGTTPQAQGGSKGNATAQQQGQVPPSGQLQTDPRSSPGWAAPPASMAASSSIQPPASGGLGSSPQDRQVYGVQPPGPVGIVSPPRPDPLPANPSPSGAPAGGAQANYGSSSFANEGPGQSTLAGAGSVGLEEPGRFSQGRALAEAQSPAIVPPAPSSDPGAFSGSGSSTSPGLSTPSTPSTPLLEPPPGTASSSRILPPPLPGN